jgi:hypothetical protein
MTASKYTPIALFYSFITFAGYKVIWILAILSPQHGHWWLPMSASVVYAGFCARQLRNKQMILGLPIISLLGICVEFFIFKHWVYEFKIETAFIPLWLIAIWTAFPGMFLVNLCQLSLPALVGIGLFFGPMAYKGAESLGAIHLVNGAVPLLILAGAWAALLAFGKWIQSTIV